MLRVLGRMLTGKTAVTKGTGAEVLHHTVKDAKGGELPLEAYRGKVCLVVNVASKCGFTPQYTALEELHRQYKDRGLAVLAFPCNDFGGQEPGSMEEIKSFCSTKYNISFDLLGKVTVKGDASPDFYKDLTGPANGPFAGEIGWNFTKFLIDREGRVCGRFEPNVKPDDPRVVKAIEEALG